MSYCGQYENEQKCQKCGANTIQGGEEVTCPPKGFKAFPPYPKA
jgi:hypothetical protein